MHKFLYSFILFVTFLCVMDISSLPSFLQEMFIGEETRRYVYALFLFIATWGGIRLFRLLVLVRLKSITEKTSNSFDDRLIEGLQNVSLVFPFFLALYVAMRSLLGPENIPKIVTGLFLLLLVYEVIKLIRVFVDFTLEKTKRRDETMINGIKLSVSLFLWATGFLLILSNLGFNISALAASLGIGGIAIALAIQNILGDLFASFSIYFDKPFRIGDFIVVGNDKGTVRKIGLKTTRVRTLQGEELVISNRELTSARVQNFKKMQKRRVSFSLGVEYDTSSALVKTIPTLVEKAITTQEGAEFERCHFAEFGDSALLFDIVYYIDSGDYGVYMDIQQEVNLSIKDQFEKKKVSMAFPTQTVYVRK